VDPDFPRAFGVAIRDVRKERGMTQMNIDSTREIHRTTLSNWERGVNLPTLESVLVLCDILECPPSELFLRAEQNLAAMKRSKKPPRPPKRGRPPKPR
jgi:DNA-binding XRE family transcriptional regulator